MCLFVSLFFRNLLDRDTFSKSDPSKLLSHLTHAHAHTQTHTHTNTHNMSTHASSQQAEQTHADTCTFNIHRQTSTTCRQSLTVLTQASLHYTWRNTHTHTHTHTHALPCLCESVDICICQGSYSSLFSAPNVSEGSQIILTHQPTTSLLQIKRHSHTHTRTCSHIHTPRSLDSRGSIWQLVQWFLKARSANRQQFALIETRRVVDVEDVFLLVEMQTAFLILEDGFVLSEHSSTKADDQTSDLFFFLI